MLSSIGQKLLKSMDYDAALEDGLKTAVEELVTVGKVVTVAFRGKILVLKLRDIAEKLAGTDDPDTIKGVARSLGSLLRSRTKWLVRPRTGNLTEVHIPADIPGLYATLTTLTTVTSDF